MSKKINISYFCQCCGEKAYINGLDKKGYLDWEDGVHIQNALPNTPVEIREQLILKWCKSCMRKLYGE